MYYIYIYIYKYNFEFLFITIFILEPKMDNKWTGMMLNTIIGMYSATAVFLCVLAYIL